MFEIHSSARENFDLKAAELVDAVCKLDRSDAESGFESGIFVAVSLDDTNIIGEPTETSVDFLGRTTGRYFLSEGVRYGIESPYYDHLSTLSESIQRLTELRDRLSQDYIEEELFEWVKGCFLSGERDSSFIDSLMSSAVNAVKVVNISVPVANMTVERPFEFCGAMVSNLPKEYFDQIERESKLKNSHDEHNEVLKSVDSLRKDFQGFASVNFTLECESKLADDLSIEKAKIVTGLLGIYSGAVFHPEIKCISKIKGAELLESSTIFLECDGDKRLSQKLLDRASLGHWCISSGELENYKRCGMGVLSDMVVRDDLTEFEKSVLSMSYLYSKVAFSSHPMDKIVYALSVLESSLLKTENEPIQQNLSERLALFISGDLSERKEIVKNVKAVYGYRSRYLHHGISSSETETLISFLRHVWMFFCLMLGASKSYKDKAEFLNSIDDRKLS